MLIGGWLPLSAAGTAVLAIRSAGGSLQQFLFAVNSCYEDGLYFSDYLAFCADAADRVAAGGATPPPAGFDQIEARGVSFRYPGTSKLALDDVTVTIGRGEVIALVGENGSGKTTLAKLLGRPVPAHVGHDLLGRERTSPPPTWTSSASRSRSSPRTTRTGRCQ